MSLETVDLSSFPPAPNEIIQQVPPAGQVFQPESVEQLAQMMESATDAGAVVLPWGAGTHQGIGYPVFPDVVLSTRGLDRVVAYEPDDLTLVVEAGVTLGAIEEMLAEHTQTAGLPEFGTEATVGGVVAAGISGFRRARFGPTRDRVLQVTLVTGDGRVVTGGSTVVKNVSGYDLPRFATGSLGALGIIASVCLKLWPVPEARCSVELDVASPAMHSVHRPLAVLSTRHSTRVYLQGPAGAVQQQAERLGGVVQEGHEWPDVPAGAVRFSLTVAPSDIDAVVDRLPADVEYLAQRGVGRIDAAGPADVESGLPDLRAEIEERGGRLVITGAEDDDIVSRVDPWGTAPPALELQKQLIAGFDPHRIINRGRLPGRL
jgi:glycolate oxidase FAD binding subunit